MSEWSSNDTWLVIDSWSLTAQIKNSICGQREFCKITMTSSRYNLHFPTSIPLLIFDWQPPPWYKFLSLLSLLLPLKSKMVAIIFVTKILSSRSPKLHLLCRLVNHTTCLQNSQVSRIECKTPPKNSIQRSQAESIMPHACKVFKLLILRQQTADLSLQVQFTPHSCPTGCEHFLTIWNTHADPPWV